MDTGEKLINISQLVDNYSQEHIAATLALHAFTGADCTSAFKGKVRTQTLYTYLLQWIPRGRLMMIILSMASRNVRVACMGLNRE